MKSSNDSKFNRYYEQHCKHLKLKGLKPKTIEAHDRGIRRIGARVIVPLQIQRLIYKKITLMSFICLKSESMVTICIS